MQKITTYLTFDGRGEEAVNFYCSLFKDAEIISLQRYPEGVPGQAGMLMNATFKIHGQQFMAMDVPGGFPKGEGMSLFVDCEDQNEVDRLWEKMTEGGEEQPCGWLKDKYNVSWQIIPSALPRLIGGPDPEGAQRALQAMLQMKKIDVAALEKAYAGD